MELTVVNTLLITHYLSFETVINLILGYEYLMSGHAFSVCVVLALLLLSRCPFAGTSHGTVLLTCQWSSLGCSIVESSVFISENRRFAVQPSLPSLNQDTNNLSANNNKDLVDNRPLSSLVTGNDCNILFNTSNCFAYSSPERRLSVAPKRDVKRHKRPCAYVLTPVPHSIYRYLVI